MVDEKLEQRFVRRVAAPKDRRTHRNVYLKKIFPLFCKRTECGGAPLINVRVQLKQMENLQPTSYCNQYEERKVRGDGPKPFKEQMPREAGSRYGVGG